MSITLGTQPHAQPVAAIPQTFPCGYCIRAMALHGMRAELDLIQRRCQGKKGNQAQEKKNNECSGVAAFLPCFHIITLFLWLWSKRGPPVSTAARCFSQQRSLGDSPFFLLKVSPFDHWRPRARGRIRTCRACAYPRNYAALSLPSSRLYDEWDLNPQLPD